VGQGATQDALRQIGLAERWNGVGKADLDGYGKIHHF